MRISLHETNEKIVKCFLDEKFNVVLWNNNGFSFYLYSFDKSVESFCCNSTKDSKSLTIKINYCQYFQKNEKYLMISSNNKASFFHDNKDFI